MIESASLSDVRDLISSFTAGIIAVLAITGYAQWRKQIIGKAKYEVAASLLTIIYKLQTETDFVRQAFIPVEEYPDATADKVDVEVYARIKRFRKLGDTFADFEGQLFKAKAIIGKNQLKSVEDLRGHINELFKSLWMYVQLRRTPRSEEAQSKYYKVIVDHDIEDEYKPRFKILVEDIEQSLGGYLQ